MPDLMNVGPCERHLSGYEWSEQLRPISGRRFGQAHAVCVPLDAEHASIRRACIVSELPESKRQECRPARVFSITPFEKVDPAWLVVFVDVAMQEPVRPAARVAAALPDRRLWLDAYGRHKATVPGLVAALSLVLRTVCGCPSTERCPAAFASTLTSVRNVTDFGYWEVTLHAGHTIEVWADGYQEIDGAHVFGVLADADEEEQKGLLITGRTPTDPKRVIVGLCRFPIEAVASINGGPVVTQTD